MKENISLKEAELKVFRSTYADGLWDIFIGCYFLEFVIAPFLSVYMGDFWSSVIFLPFWGLVYLGIWLTRKYVVAPRIGKVTFGRTRKRKLRIFSIVMLAVNVVAFILGLVVALTFSQISGVIITGMFGLILLTGFSLAATFLDYPRLYLYGLLLFAAPWVGEWLYQNRGASHHGWPIVFGFTSGLMIVIGLILFVRFIRSNPKVEMPSGDVI